MINVRLGTHHSKKKHVLDLIHEAKKYEGSIDIVWFSSLYGFPSLETHEKYARELGEVAKLFRDAGIKVSMQIANTLGHGEYMKNRNNSGVSLYSLEKMVGHDGTVADLCFCPGGKKLIEYTKKEVEIYCRILKPDTVWIDDDFRITNHLPVKVGCFCDECVNQFNENNSTSFGRDELSRLVNKGDSIWREKYFELMKERLSNFASEISKSVHAVSPQTRMAYQYSYEMGKFGGDVCYTLDAMKKECGKSPAIRIGGGAYHDKNPFDMFEKQLLASLAMSRLPDYVKYRVPEIENTPDVFYGKTNYSTLYESTVALAYGFTGLSYATLMTPYEPLSFHAELLSGISKRKKYWHHLAETNTKTQNGCIGIPPTSLYIGKSENTDFDFMDTPCEGASALTMIGFAESHEWKNAPIIHLRAPQIDRMTDEVIEELISRAVIADGKCIEKLCERGFSEKLGIRATMISEIGLCECFETPNKLAEEDVPLGTLWLRSGFTKGDKSIYTFEGDKCEKEFGYLIKNKNKEYFGITSAVFRTTLGGKWAVVGHSLEEEVISTVKRQQIMNMLEMIGPLPAFIRGNERVTCIPRIDSKGKTVSVSIVCVSITPTEEMELIINKPQGERFTYENAENKIQLTPEYIGENKVLLRLPPFVRGYDAATVFVD